MATPARWRWGWRQKKFAESVCGPRSDLRKRDDVPYTPRITIEAYVMTMLSADAQLLPPRKPGCYSVWSADFTGDEPRSTDMGNIVWVGKADKTGLLYRVTGLVLDAIGITGAEARPGSKYSYYHVGGRAIFLGYGNQRARELLLAWCDDVSPPVEERRIYNMWKEWKNRGGGGRLLNKRKP